MKDTLLAINDETLGTLSLEVLDYVDDISEIFEEIDKQMSSLSACYQGKSRNLISAYYSDVKKNYSIIKNNIKSYSDDFICLINKMQANDKTAGNKAQDYISDIKNKVRSEKNEEAIEWL